ncbi:MAG TPA: glycosyltransferase [Gemmataceae bacterium]|jgi:GT2 family glycosyltransferase
MPAPPLSIVIPTHNRADLLRLCLRSVVRHAPPDTEIIVAADGSPGAAVGDEFPGVRLVRLPRRRGFCGAANAGIAAARGEIVELLNDDTEVTAGWAAAALACFADPRVAAVAPLVLVHPASGVALAPRVFHQSATVVRARGAHATPFAKTIIDSAGDGYDRGGFARKLGHGEPLTADHRRREVFGASGSSAFYRRELLLRVGGFPESFGAYFEDVDLAFRLRRAGGVIIFEPGSRVLHHGGSSYGRPNRRLVEQQSCNEERVWWRNLPGRDLVRSLPRHLAVLAAKAARRWREGLLLPWACGRLRAWSEVVADRRHQRQLGRLGPSAALADWHVAPRPW